MNAWITSVLMLAGALFMFLAAVGILRLPDLFTRMQATTKAGTLGIGCMLLGVAANFGTLSVTTRAVLVILFFFLTAPVAAHMIARASYFVGLPLYHGTVLDELRGRYDPQTHVLESPAGPAVEEGPREPEPGETEES